MKSKNEFGFGFDKLHSILEKWTEAWKSKSKCGFPNQKHPSVGRLQMNINSKIIFVFNVINQIHKVNFPL